MDPSRIVQLLRQSFPNLLAVYAYGSRISGGSGPDSDLDIAILVAGYADPVALFDTANQLADIVRCDVDLVDLRAASTVMQHQILTTGERWWNSDIQADLFEVAALSEMTALNSARRELLQDIVKRGSVYER